MQNVPPRVGVSGPVIKSIQAAIKYGVQEQRVIAYDRYRINTGKLARNRNRDRRDGPLPSRRWFGPELNRCIQSAGLKRDFHFRCHHRMP